MSFKEKLELQVISHKEPPKLLGSAVSNEKGFRGEINNTAIRFIHTFSICNFNQPKEKKVPNVQVKKIQTADTGLTNTSYFMYSCISSKNLSYMYVQKLFIHSSVQKGLYISSEPLGATSW